MENERWVSVTISPFQESYMVSDRGRIYSKHSKKVMVSKRTGTGYLRVTLCNKGFQKTVGIHRIVALAFIPNPENKPTVNHINENKEDNSVGNLEWATTAEQNVYGTRTERAMENMDWKARSDSTDYQSIAAKHDYQRDDMCNRKKTAVFLHGSLIGIFKAQSEAAKEAGISASKVCAYAKNGTETRKGYTFQNI